MSCARFFLAAAAVTGALHAQTAPNAVELANLNEDVQGLVQRVNDLTLRVETLEHQNSALRRENEQEGKGCATLVQLNDAIAALNRDLEAQIAASKNSTLELVSARIEKLARETNAALDAIGRAPAAAPAAAAPAEGGRYTVQKGDTLALIAKKTGAKVADIISANQIQDPSRILIGQVLVIPGGR